MSKTEGRNKLKQIRQAREETDKSKDGPEVYQCPVDGCNRTIVGEPGHLRNHVSQSNDNAHQYRTLDESLDVVVHWAEMDWGWGAPKSQS